MKRVLFSLCILCLCVLTGCAAETPRLSAEELRAQYAESPYIGGGRPDFIPVFTHEMIFLPDVSWVVLSSAGEMVRVPGDITDEYGMDFQVERVLSGGLHPGETAAVTVPGWDSGLLGTMNGGQLLAGLIRQETPGYPWRTARELVFFLSGSGQIVPLLDDAGHSDLTGLTLQEFSKLIR